MCMDKKKRIWGNICLFFNQSKSVPVNKDQFKPYYSCKFTLTRIYLYALGTHQLPCSCNLQRYLLYQHNICKVICLKKQNRIVQISKGLCVWFLKLTGLNIGNVIHKKVT